MGDFPYYDLGKTVFPTIFKYLMGDFPYYDLGKTTPQIRQNPFEMP